MDEVKGFKGSAAAGARGVASVAAAPALSASQRQTIRRRFFEAITVGRADLIHQGFELGVKPTATNPFAAGERITAFHQLAGAGLMGSEAQECFDALIIRCDPNARDALEQTPLMIAAQNQDAWLVATLLPISDPYAKDDMGMSALMHAASKGASAALLGSLMSASDPAARDAWGRTALMRASRVGHLVGVKALMQVGDPRAVDDDGRGALMHALDGNRDSVELVRALLAVADPNARDARGVSPLRLAMECGHLQSAQALLPVTDLLAIHADGLMERDAVMRVMKCKLTKRGQEWFLPLLRCAVEAQELRAVVGRHEPAVAANPKARSL